MVIFIMDAVLRAMPTGDHFLSTGASAMCMQYAHQISKN